MQRFCDEKGAKFCEGTEIRYAYSWSTRAREESRENEAEQLSREQAM